VGAIKAVVVVGAKFTVWGTNVVVTGMAAVTGTAVDHVGVTAVTVVGAAKPQRRIRQLSIARPGYQPRTGSNVTVETGAATTGAATTGADTTGENATTCWG
jgi:hypothetical protein